jgi:WD40 repeat protein
MNSSKQSSCTVSKRWMGTQRISRAFFACFLSAGLMLGCGASEFKALGSVECVPRGAASVTASDYDAGHDTVALGYRDGSFELRRGATEVFACGGHSVPISNVAFSPDGAVLASGDIVGRVALSHVEERKTEPLVELASEIFGLAFSPSGSLIALSAGPEVMLIDRSGTRVARASLPEDVGAVTFSRDGKMLIAASRSITFLSVPNLRMERSVTLRPEGSRERGEPATDVRFSPNGRRLGVLLLGGVAVLDLDTWRLAIETAIGWDPVGLRFAPNGRMAVFGRDRLYVGPAEPDRLANESFAPSGELADVEFRRDGKLLFVAGPIPTLAELPE